MHKIDSGKGTLLGFSDFFSGEEEIGALKRPPKKAPAPKGPAKPVAKIPYPKAKASTTVAHHGKVLAKAHQTMTKSSHILGRVQQVLGASKHIPGPVKVAPAHTTAAAAVHVGVAVPNAAAKSLTPKQQAAVVKHNKAVIKATQAAKVLAQHGVAAKKSNVLLAKRMINQKKTAVAMRKPAHGVAGRHVPAGHKPMPRHHLGAHAISPSIEQESFDHELEKELEDYYTLVGASPDPNNPGFLDDGTPDPAYGDVGLDTSLDDSGLSGGALADDGAGMDSGTLGPAPDMDYVFDDMTQVGGIAYNGSKGTPEGYVGSLHLFDRGTDIDIEPNTAEIEGNAHFGYVWGNYGKDYGGVSWGTVDSMPCVWNHFHGRHYLGDTSWVDKNVPDSEAFASWNKNSDGHAPGVNGGGAAGWKFASLAGKPYGPLVGNPFYKDFARMRVDKAGNMFWLPQEAPDWLTFPLKQAASLTAQAEAKAAADAAKADAAAAAKAAADAAAAQAQQDAANALAESQAASASRQAQSQAEADQAAAETQAQQALVQQQQADTQQQTVQTEQEKAAGELLLQQAASRQAQDEAAQKVLLQAAQQEADYYAQHPDERPDYGDSAEGGDEGGVDQDDGGDQGGEGGPSDDDVLSEGVAPTGDLG